MNAKVNSAGSTAMTGSGSVIDRSTGKETPTQAEIEEMGKFGNMCEAQDIANLVLYLASDEAAFITGQIIRVDGGALSHLAHVAQLRDAGVTTNQK